MVLSIRSSILLGVLALALLAGSAVTGVLPVGPQPARAADETGEETTTTPTEEPPPVIETPTEPETTPEPETPVTAPPVTTPPVGAPSGGESGGSVETPPKSTPSTGSEATGGGSGGGGGGTGGGGSSSGGSAGSGSSGGATTTPATTPSRQTTRAPSRTTGQRNSGGGGGGNDSGGDRESQAGGGGGGRDASGGGGGGQRHPAPASGGPAPQPTVSPQAIDEGASAVSNAASHVGEAFAKALPTAPLKKIGDKLTAHIAAGDAANGGKGQKQSADGIGAALGAALLGSAVAVDRTPVGNNSPIPFFTPPGGKSGTIYLVLIAVLLLAVGALVFREARSALGFDKPRTGVRVADEKPRIALSERLGVAMAGLQGATQRWFSRFRRLRANAAAGLRSLF